MKEHKYHRCQHQFCHDTGKIRLENNHNPSMQSPRPPHQQHHNGKYHVASFVQNLLYICLIRHLFYCSSLQAPAPTGQWRTISFVTKQGHNNDYCKKCNRGMLPIETISSPSRKPREREEATTPKPRGRVTLRHRGFFTFCATGKSSSPHQKL